MELPVYISISDDIKKKIIDGEYTPGTAIPSERKLCEEYNVSRMTIRQAVNTLVNEGYIYRIKGSGTFISEKKIEKNKQGLTSFTEDMIQRGMTPGSEIISFEKMFPSEVIANRLGIETYEGVFKIERVRLADGEPMAYETVYRPVKYSPELTPVQLEGSIYKTLEENGLKVSYAEQSIEAVISIESTSKYLQIPLNSPLLLIKSISHLENNDVIQYTRSYYRADKYKLKQTINR
jgi:GntR family transcriptional regulator